jgi:hypothetical protein
MADDQTLPAAVPETPAAEPVLVAGVVEVADGSPARSPWLPAATPRS